jgi:DNA/RNA-binding domain of Phe-tRNA-synthetase-like protein
VLTKLNFVLEKLTSLSDGINLVTATLGKKYDALSSRIDKLKGNTLVADDEQATMKSHWSRKPYA